jgi:hypothetical protein
MDTVWERLAGKGLCPVPLPFLEAKYSFFFSSLQLMPCSSEVADDLGIPMLLLAC